MSRIYLSNIRPAWPLDRQRAVLAEHYPDAAGGSEYVDDLPPRKRKKPAAADLEQRAEMLKPRGRRQVDDIVAASLAPLAVSQLDLVDVLAAAELRGSVLIAVAEGVVLTPPYGAGAIAETLAKFAAAIHRARGNTKLGHAVSAERRAARAKAACELIRERWRLPMKDHPTNQLLREADVARATAVFYLGDRKQAIADYARSQAVAERNRKRGGHDGGS